MRRLHISNNVLETHSRHFSVIQDVLWYLSACKKNTGNDSVKLYRSTDSTPKNLPFCLSQRVCSSFFELVKMYEDQENQYHNRNFLTISADDIPLLNKDINDKVYNRLDDKEKTTVYEILKVVFNYDAFAQCKTMEFVDFKDGKAIKLSSGKEAISNWGAGSYLKALGVRYCVYCNAETLYAVNYRAWEDNDPSLTDYLVNHSAFDHFYPLDRYPHLGLTLSNLVPACSRCNSAIKGKKDFSDMLNPYIDDFHSIKKFVYIPDTVRDCYSAPEAKLLMLFPRDENEGAKNSLADKYVCNFHLLNVYQTIYKDEVEDIIYRRNTLRHTLLKMHEKRFNIPDDTLRLLSGLFVSEDDINRHRFGKLLVDLCFNV